MRRHPARIPVVPVRRTSRTVEYHPHPASFWVRFSPLAAWMALILSLIVASTVLRKAPRSVRPANSTILLLAKDFGAGISTLLLESYHTYTWSRESVRLDSSVTPASVQELAGQLRLPVRISVIVADLRVRQLVPTGGVLPQSIVDGLEDNWDPQVAAACEAAALLRWAAWQGVLLDRWYGGTFEDQLENDFQQTWPNVAKRINRRLQQLGIDDRLDEVYSSNREHVAERCWQIDEALERHLSAAGN
ncbi:MAG: hypothetical protein V2A56_10120 [bacterium]